MRGVGLALGAGLLLAAGGAQAVSGYPADFLNQYPQAGPTVSSAANNCSLCHTSPPSLNAYGSDLTGGGGIGSRLAAAEQTNSDGDADSAANACNNITEIDADTLPASASSTPASCGAAQPPAADTSPVADADGPYSGTVNVPVQFDGSFSSDDGTIVSFEWDFGDGNTATGEAPTHTYAADGTYTVTLTVTDDTGATDTDTTDATVGVGNQPPIADANGGVSGTVNVPVQFDGSFSSDDGTIVSYEWNFGDGNTGTGAMPTHTYAMDGTFNVMLTVMDDTGATDSDGATATIGLVAQPPGSTGPDNDGVDGDGDAKEDDNAKRECDGRRDDRRRRHHRHHRHHRHDKDHQAYEAHRDRKDHGDHEARKDHGDHEARKDHGDREARKDHEDHEHHEARKDQGDHEDHHEG